jgi:preprotein translocase subunit SecE
VARDRKRARQRQRRPVRETAPPADGQELRPNVPEAVQHTGEVDEFDAALLRGARPHEADGEELDGDFAAEEPLAANPFAEGEPVGAPAGGARARRRASEAESGEDERGAVDRPRRSAAPARRSGGNRAIAFLRASWAELQRVQWPDRRQVAQATAVVLGFVVVAGVYLGVADWVAQKVVNFVL